MAKEPVVLVELTVVEQRYRAVLDVLAGASVVEVARRNGVTRQTVHEWLRRYANEGGLGGLADLQLLDLRGDVAGGATVGRTGLSATYTYDEFGNLTSGSGARYGWLGGKLRGGTSVGGFVLPSTIPIPTLRLGPKGLVKSRD